MELDEAIKILKSYENKLVYEISEKDKKAVTVVLNHLTKQEKMIELMLKLIRADDIDEDICQYEGICDEYECEECIKQYFEKKVEESE